MPRSIALLLLLLVACERPREVSVRISIPGLDSVETPASGITVLALPYDVSALDAGAVPPAPEPRVPEPLAPRGRHVYGLGKKGAERAGYLAEHRRLPLAPWHEQFGAFAQWVVLNRGGLTIFAHATTGDDLADHRHNVIWFGPSEALDLSIFGDGA